MRVSGCKRAGGNARGDQRIGENLGVARRIRRLLHLRAGRDVEARASQSQSLFLSMLLSMPAAGALIGLALPIVRVLFEPLRLRLTGGRGLRSRERGSAAQISTFAPSSITRAISLSAEVVVVRPDLGS